MKKELEEKHEVEMEKMKADLKEIHFQEIEELVHKHKDEIEKLKQSSEQIPGDSTRYYL